MIYILFISFNSSQIVPISQKTSSQQKALTMFYLQLYFNLIIYATIIFHTQRDSNLEPSQYEDLVSPLPIP